MGAGFSRGGEGDTTFGASRIVSETFSPPTGPAAGGQPPSGPRNSFSSGQAPAFSRQTSTTGAPPAGPRGGRFASTANGSDVAMPDAPTGPKASRRPTEPTISAAPANRLHPALADLPKVIEGGQRAESIVDRSKLAKLEEDAERIRKQIEEREAKKRHGLKDWERLSRAKEAAEFRSDLAKEALESLNGDVESQAAF